MQGSAISLLPRPGVTAEDLGSDVYDFAATDTRGPVFVVQGNSGGLQREKWVQPQPEWSARRFANGCAASDTDDMCLLSYSDTFGFGVATFVNSTHLHYSAVPVTGTSGTDDFWIVKRRG
jgi:hypothetical protein